MNNDVRAALKFLRDRGPLEVDAGICLNLELVLGRDVPTCAVGEVLSAWWEKHSGDNTYPIPHKDRDPERAYADYGNVWDRRRQYGRDRYEALDCLIEHADELKELL